MIIGEEFVFDLDLDIFEDDHQPVERGKGSGLMNASDPKDCPGCPTVTHENYMKLLNGVATQVETIDGDMVGVGDAPFNIAHASDEEPDLD